MEAASQPDPCDLQHLVFHPLSPTPSLQRKMLLDHWVTRCENQDR